MQMSSVTFEDHVKKDKATLSGLGLVKVTFFFFFAFGNVAIAGLLGLIRYRPPRSGYRSWN